MRVRPDFIQIALSDAGIAFAGAGGTLRVATGAMSYTFAAGQPVEVMVSEWRLLRKDCDAEGKALFDEFVSTAAVETGAAKGEVSNG